MNAIGEINVFVTDVERAVAFWSKGLGLKVGEKETLAHSGYARLDFADGSPSIRLLLAAGPAPEERSPGYGSRPMIGFDVVTEDFDRTLARLIEFGGWVEGGVQKAGEVRYAFVSDPDGNAFELVEMSAERAAGDDEA